MENFLNQEDGPQPLLSNINWLLELRFSAYLEMFLNKFNLKLKGKIVLICKI